MNMFEGRFTSHGLHVRLKEIEVELSNRPLNDMPVDDAFIAKRTLKLVSALRDFLGPLDAELLSQQMLDKSERLAVQLHKFTVSGDWQNVLQVGDRLLSTLSAFPVVLELSGSIGKSIHESREMIDVSLATITQKEEQFKEALHSVEAQNGRFQSKLAELAEASENLASKLSARHEEVQQIRAEIDLVRSEAAQKLDRMFSEHEAKFRDWLTTQQSQFNDQQSQRQEHYFEQVRGWNNTFNSAEQDRVTEYAKNQAERLREHNEWQTTWEQQFNTIRGAHQKEFQKALESNAGEFKISMQGFVNTTQSVITELQVDVKEALAKHLVQVEEELNFLAEKREEAAKIVGIIADSGMTGHYKSVANWDWWTAEILRLIALLCFGGLALIVWRVVQQITAENFNWEVALFRLAVGVVLLGPAMYCARESTRHRRNEERNRRRALELASLGPYLEKLGEENSLDVRQKLVTSYFGNSTNEPLHGFGKKLDDLSLKDLLKELEPVLALVKALK